MDSVATDPAAVAANVEEVRSRIRDACARAGRSEADVTLVAVTKTWPLDAVRAAHAAGVRDFGENKVQELVDKAGRFPGAYGGGDHRWHLIGHLQRNKAKDAVAHADVFHALDSPRLARELEKRLAREERTLPCFVQVNVSGEESKYGLEPEAAADFLATASDHPHLRIVGLMTLAAPTDDPEDVRPQFRRLRSIFDAARKSGAHPHLRFLSMGMSGDYEVAVEEGATHVRVGSAIFGARSYE